METARHPQLEALAGAVYDFCRDYAKNPNRGRRLVIYGPNGVGKSHAARAIHRWAKSVSLLIPWTDEQGPGEERYDLARSQYLFWPEIVDGFKQDRWWVVEEAANRSLLVIDDIGADHDPSGIGREKLYWLLERRAQKWMVMTTNVPVDQWEKKFERRIASRLLRNSEIIDLSEVGDYCAK